MDSIIQSQTQSAIVQKLSETEHSVKRFTGDIPDNAPFRSMSKRVLQPYMGANTGQASTSSTIHFRVPRNGFLVRAYLRCKLFLSDPPSTDELRPSHNKEFANKSFGSDFFASFMDKVVLSIGGKEVETLLPEEILHRAYALKGNESENVLYGMRGRFSGYGESDFGDLGFDGELPLVPDTDCDEYVNFLIPLEFSTFKFHKDALDTNFVNQIEIRMEKHPIRVMQTVGLGIVNTFTTCELVCKYYNVHDHFRNQIRNGNHSRDTSTLLVNSSLLTTPRVTSELITTPTDYARNVYHLESSDLFVTDILVTFRKLNAENEDFKGDIVTQPNHQADFLKFTLRANDRTLYEKYHYEMRFEDSNVSSQYISDDSHSLQGSKWFPQLNTGNVQGHGGLSDTVDFPTESYEALYNSPDALNITRFGTNMYRIPLSLMNTDEFLNGGLDFGSLADIQLIIEGQPLLPEENTFDAWGCETHIVLRHKQLLRIDSKTGAVSL